MWTPGQITSPQFMELDNSLCELRCSGENIEHRVSTDGFWGKPEVGQIHRTGHSWGIWGLLLHICVIYGRSLASIAALCQSELASFWIYTDNVPYITSDALFCFYHMFSEHLLFFFLKKQDLFLGFVTLLSLCWVACIMPIAQEGKLDTGKLRDLFGSTSS